MVEFTRELQAPDRSFFLFGPRSVGKSTFLAKHFSEAFKIDLLDSETFLALSRRPNHLSELLESQKQGLEWVVIDEIQKIPALLDEVHRIMNSQTLKFALSGSSARKLKRSGANLLAGRAVTRMMEGLAWQELDQRASVEQLLTWGSLPQVCLEPENAADILSAYVSTYIKEEIREEGLIRKIEPFLRFLEIAGMCNGQKIVLQNISRDAQVPASNVQNYFSILVDTLVGHWLPAYRPGFKVREVASPKFYWFDPGVARASADLLRDNLESTWLGFALETLIFHELRVYNHVREKHRFIGFYETGAGVEVDFVVETKKKQAASPAHIILLEVKLATRWKNAWEKPSREIALNKKTRVERMIGIYMGKDTLHVDGYDVMPVSTFLAELWAGNIF